jgi:hypothetical protein
LEETLCGNGRKGVLLDGYSLEGTPGRKVLALCLFGSSKCNSDVFAVHACNPRHTERKKHRKGERCVWAGTKGWLSSLSPRFVRFLPLSSFSRFCSSHAFPLSQRYCLGENGFLHKRAWHYSKQIIYIYLKYIFA